MSGARHIEPADLDDPRIEALIAAHMAAALAVTPRENNYSLDIAGLREPALRVWALHDDGAIVAIGALKRLSAGQAELKSMFTDPERRRTGAAGAMLAHILAAARADGVSHLYLETGSHAYFAAACALYEKHGFVYCEPFGSYRADEHNLFMMLDLERSREPA